MEPAVVIASKNVLAPGPGVAAYSVAKAGLTSWDGSLRLNWGRWHSVNMLHQMPFITRNLE
jgi:NAD(P)-dependent dehydrogenase (short-subunit alcohol dehydrogenase family)